MLTGPIEAENMGSTKYKLYKFENFLPNKSNSPEKRNFQNLIRTDHMNSKEFPNTFLKTDEDLIFFSKNKHTIRTSKFPFLRNPIAIHL